MRAVVSMNRISQRFYNILKKGSLEARETAAQTMEEVRAAMQINYFEDTELIQTQAERFRQK